MSGASHLVFRPYGSLSALCWWLMVEMAQVSTEEHCLGPASIRAPQAPEKVSQFLVGPGAWTLGLGCGRMPAIVTLGDLPHVDIHGHSLGLV